MLNGLSSSERWALQKYQVFLQIASGKSKLWNSPSCDCIEVAGELRSCSISITYVSNRQITVTVGRHGSWKLCPEFLSMELVSWNCYHKFDMTLGIILKFLQICHTNDLKTLLFQSLCLVDAKEFHVSKLSSLKWGRIISPRDGGF